MVFDTVTQQLSLQVEQLKQSLASLEQQRQQAVQQAEANKVSVQTGSVTESQPVYAREFFTATTSLSARYPDPLRIVGTRQVQIPVYEKQVQPEDAEKIRTIESQIAEFSAQLQAKTQEFESSTLNAVSGLASMLENAVEPDKPFQPNLISLGVPAAVIGIGLVALYFLSKK